MTPDEYKLAGDLFEQFRELPESELAAALDEACADNAELRANVARFLAADRDADVRFFLEQPAIEDAARLIAPGVPRVPPPGTVIGNYRLGAAIGVGGMGVVLEGEDQPISTAAIHAARLATPSRVRSLAPKPFRRTSETGGGILSNAPPPHPVR